MSNAETLSIETELDNMLADNNMMASEDLVHNVNQVSLLTPPSSTGKRKRDSSENSSDHSDEDSLQSKRAKDESDSNCTIAPATWQDERQTLLSEIAIMKRKIDHVLQREMMLEDFIMVECGRRLNAFFHARETLLEIGKGQNGLSNPPELHLAPGSLHLVQVLKRIKEKCGRSEVPSSEQIHEIEKNVASEKIGSIASGYLTVTAESEGVCETTPRPQDERKPRKKTERRRLREKVLKRMRREMRKDQAKVLDNKVLRDHACTSSAAIPDPEQIQKKDDKPFEKQQGEMTRDKMELEPISDATTMTSNESEKLSVTGGPSKENKSKPNTQQSLLGTPPVVAQQFTLTSRPTPWLISAPATSSDKRHDDAAIQSKGPVVSVSNGVQQHCRPRREPDTRNNFNGGGSYNKQGNNFLPKPSTYRSYHSGNKDNKVTTRFNNVTFFNDRLPNAQGFNHFTFPHFRTSFSNNNGDHFDFGRLASNNLPPAASRQYATRNNPQSHCNSNNTFRPTSQNEHWANKNAFIPFNNKTRQNEEDTFRNNTNNHNNKRFPVHNGNGNYSSGRQRQRYWNQHCDRDRDRY